MNAQEHAIKDAMIAHDIDPSSQRFEDWANQRERRGRRWIPFAAAAAVAAVAIGVTTVLISAPPSTQTASNTSNASSTASSVQASIDPIVVATYVGGTDGMPSDGPDTAPTSGPGTADERQLVQLAGLQLAVPASWPLDAARCGTATRDTVLFIFPDRLGHAACKSSQPASASVVELLYPTTVSDYAGIDVALARTETTINGVRVLIGQAGAATIVVVPDLQVAASITSPDAGLVDDILHSLTVVPVIKPGECCSDR